jgi:predicted Rdx family selenoprotein
VADLLKQELGITKVDLIPGDRGEFTVRVKDEIVARKTERGFPEDKQIVNAVRAAL